MSEQYLLGVDIGTSSSTGIVVDPELNVVESVSTPHEVSYPNPGWAEQHPEDVWWDDFTEITATIFDRTDIAPEQITGIGVSGLAPTMVPLDETGTPLRPAILYGVDTRSSEEIEILNEQIGEDRIYEVSGNSLTYQSVGPKILWYKRNEPEKFEQTEKILDTTGFINYKLTGNYAIDNATAGFFPPLYNPSELEWEEEMFEEIGLSTDTLPETKWSTEITGHVTESASEATGLAEGTPVIAGSFDALTSLISVGGVEDGDSVFMYATTGVMYTTVDEERRTPELWCTPHCLEGKYAIGGGMATAGAITEWYINEFGGRAVDTDSVGKVRYQHLNDEAAKIPPGSEGVMMLPYFSGERTPINDDSARGTITGLTLSHTKYHVYRAILEAVGYGFRHHYEVMKQADVPVDDVLAIGGGAQSDLWRQIVSDITGVAQHYVSDPIGAPLGDAYLAGLGTGVFDDLGPLKEKTSVKTTTEPDFEANEIYDEYYPVYRNLYSSIKDDMHDLAELGKRYQQ